MILLQPAMLILHNILTPFILSHSINSILSTYRAAVFADLESIVNPEVYIYVERACNFGIFDHALTGSPCTLLRKTAGRLVPTAAVEKKPCAILSPFLTELAGLDCFYYTYSAEGRFGIARSCFYKILDALKDSGVDSFHNELVDYTAESHRGYVLYTLEVKGAGRYLETAHRQRNELMEALARIRDEIKASRWQLRSTETVDLAVRLLVEMLKDHGVLKEAVDFEEYPELVGRLFPFRMLNLKCERGDAQLMTIGVDLSWIGDGKMFDSLFDVRKHSLRYLLTFEV